MVDFEFEVYIDKHQPQKESDNCPTLVHSRNTGLDSRDYKGLFLLGPGLILGPLLWEWPRHGGFLPLNLLECVVLCMRP